MTGGSESSGRRSPRGGARRGGEALAELAAPPGLCATCRHLQLVGSRQSVYVRCGLSDVDDRFPRYPPLPVHACAGWERDEAADR